MKQIQKYSRIAKLLEIQIAQGLLKEFLQWFTVVFKKDVYIGELIL